MIPRRPPLRYEWDAPDTTRRIAIHKVFGAGEHDRVAVLHFKASTTFVNLAAVESINVVQPNRSPLHGCVVGRRVVIAMRNGAWHEVEYETAGTDQALEAVAEIDALLSAWHTAISAS